ncbi:flagellar protein FlaG [Celerinatantimonas sp. YJH-8]|uniref:flagellar protein FlaG n=1 Tax=Celerinatantimonas sp. YJH-8 TaxID=3228714 RepID=UPI0038C188DA
MSNDIDSVITNGMASVSHQTAGDSKNRAANATNEARNLQAVDQQSTQPQLSDEDVGHIVAAANQILEAQPTAVRFKVDKSDGEMVTSIYNSSTNELIREIPSQELREISARLKEYQDATDQAGLLVDQLV